MFDISKKQYKLFAKVKGREMNIYLEPKDFNFLIHKHIFYLVYKLGIFFT